MTLKPFKRDPSEPYSRDAEVEAFFQDYYEVNRAKLEREAKHETVSGVKS